MRALVVGLILALFMGGIGADAAWAEGVEYSLKSASKPFARPQVKEPSGVVQFADAVIGRPVGFTVFALGTTFFVLTLPFTAGSGDVREAGRGMVKKPAGWTFKRRLGVSDPRFEDPSVFPIIP